MFLLHMSYAGGMHEVLLSWENKPIDDRKTWWVPEDRALDLTPNQTHCSLVMPYGEFGNIDLGEHWLR